VTVDVKNTGKRAGDEVAQLYTREIHPSVVRAGKELRGFQRVTLQPGEKKTLTFTVPAEKLAFYDEKQHAFVVEPGKYEIQIGVSSADIRERASLQVTTGSVSGKYPPVASAK
jgi:beta-glucosidase